MEGAADCSKRQERWCEKYVQQVSKRLGTWSTERLKDKNWKVDLAGLLGKDTHGK